MGGREHQELYRSSYFEHPTASGVFEQDHPYSRYLYTSRYPHDLTEESLMKDITRGLREIVKTPSEDSGVDLGSTYGGMFSGHRDLQKQYYDRKRLRSRAIENDPYSRDNLDMPHHSFSASHSYGYPMSSSSSRVRPLARGELRDLQMEREEMYPYDQPMSSSRYHSSRHLLQRSTSSPPQPLSLASLPPSHRTAVSLPSRAFSSDNAMLSKEV